MVDPTPTTVAKEQAAGVGSEGVQHGLALTEVQSLADVLSTSIDSLAELLTRVGEVEIRTRTRFSDIAKRMGQKEFIADAVRALKPEQIGLMLRILVRVSAIGDMTLEKLSPEEKLEKARALREVSHDIREFSELLRS